MRQAIIRSVCECQAELTATLDEHRFVLEGFAVNPFDKVRESAPAHTIHAERPHFDVGWLCPFCGRNALRSFSADALAWREVEAPAAAAKG
jgi:hypothetical protein